MPSINFSVTSSRQQLPYPLPANTELTMSIGNPLSYASYAGLESTPNVSGFYTTLSPKSLSGSIISSSGLIDIIQDDYKMLAVVKPGGGSIVYKPSIYISGSDLYMTSTNSSENYYFSFTVDTSLVSAGSTGGGTFRLPLSGVTPFTASVDWGDGVVNFISSSTQTAVTHNYPATGSYLIRISGSLPNWRFNGTGDRLKIKTINSWGGFLTGLSRIFFSASNLEVLASDAPVFYSSSMEFTFRDVFKFNAYLNNWDVSQVDTYRSCFNNCYLFNSPLDSWNVSKANQFHFMFSISAPNRGRFNQDIGMWNMSNATTISTMFQSQANFNQDLSRWDVSKVTDMSFMFARATSYDKPLNTWNTNNVTVMRSMFACAPEVQLGVFNQPLSNWNVSKVGDLSSVFSGQRNFNQDLSMWNVSSSTNFSYMFAACPEFTSSLENWNMANAVNLSAMFFGSRKFNSNISKWNTAKVTNMSYMFSNYWQGIFITPSDFPNGMIFNQPLATSGSSWDVSKVITFEGMFASNSFFNQDISNWNVGSATTFSGMFYSASSFNQDISSWNVSSSVYMYSMFAGATSFDQNLGSWDVRNVVGMDAMFEGVTLSTANYDALLIGWNSLPSLKPNVNFHGGYSKYSPAASASRANLISTYGWTITDGGPA